ncbi:hypothetical protein LINPERPRIM_LOCUS13654, partial [Linum perenne]
SREQERIDSSKGHFWELRSSSLSLFLRTSISSWLIRDEDLSSYQQEECPDGQPSIQHQMNCLQLHPFPTFFDPDEYSDC